MSTSPSAVSSAIDDKMEYWVIRLQQIGHHRSSVSRHYY